MKRLLIVFLLLGYFSSGAYANEQGEQKYVGVFYGIADSNIDIGVGDTDIENRNVGIVFGGYGESGLGFEFFYSDTFDEDEAQLPTGKVRYDSQIWGLLGTYRVSNGKAYALVKAGYSFIDLRAKLSGFPTQKFNEEGLSYGVGFGFEVAKNGAVELNYLLLPDINTRLQAFDTEIQNQLITLGYNIRF